MSRETSRPRRRPQRSSSATIVDAIITAAALLLDRDGFDGLTTNAISRVAGVSIGSLYQYFADKEAIVVEMARRVNTAAIGLTTEEMVQLRDATARDLLARVVDLSCSPAFLTLGARQVVSQEVPLRWVLGEYRATHNAVRLVTTGFFSARTTDTRPFVPTDAMFVSQHAFDGIIQALLLGVAGRASRSSRPARALRALVEPPRRERHVARTIRTHGDPCGSVAGAGGSRPRPTPRERAVSSTHEDTASSGAVSVRARDARASRQCGCANAGRAGL